MSEASDIGYLAMAAAYGAIAVSLVLWAVLRIRLYRDLLVAVVRMSVQLALVGYYLTALFELNNPFVNVGWVVAMTAVANLSLLRGSGLRMSLFPYTFPALLLAVAAVLAYYIFLVFTPDPIFDARYVIPVGGMVLGNSMNRTIVTLERFYRDIRRDSEGYAAFLTIGATVHEACAPYMRTAYRAGLAPQLASIATMGLVALPGMMTGQILGGSSPLVAIKYQVAIIIAIFASTELASFFTVKLSMLRGFDDLGFLRTDIFK